MKRFFLKLRILVGILFIAVVPLVMAAIVSDDVRWRLGVVGLKASGKLDDAGWSDLLRMLAPGSGFWLRPLLDSPNAFAVIHNPRGTARDIRTGRALFRSECAICHGAAAGGANAPALVGRDLTHGSSDWALFETIRDGVPGTPMRPHALPPDDLWKLVAYVQDIAITNRHEDSNEAGSSGLPILAVPFEELRTARSAAADWPTYYGSYNGYRFSNLAMIDRHNVSQLAARWIYQLPSKGARIEATPLAAGGRLFVTDPEGAVFALDGATGSLLWRFARTVPHDTSLCCVTANRGVALLGDTVFVMTLDAHLIALAGMTGAVLWDRVVADYRQGYSSTGAPLAVKDMVITGIAGSEFGAPGFIAAYDARTGSLRWRFDTIPKPGEKGNDTWAGKSWRTGGVATWMPGSYDPDLDLIFWGTANPAPDYDTSSRAGDNLYSNSVVALHADSGRLAWYFQYTPADDHDWDSVQTPVLADVVDGAQTRRLLLAANRNGFFYALDRTDGKFLRATPYVRQNWAERIEANGRPVRRAAASPSARGALVYPGTSGGTNWWPPTFSPLAQLFIVPALERPGFFFKTKLGEVRQGANIVAGVSAGTSASHFTAVRALDPRTGALRWEYTSASGHGSAELCGLLSTAGGLVFTNHKSKLVGLDIDTGREMWSFEAGGRINSSPATYLAGQEQIIAFAAGDDVIGVALPPRRAASDAP